MKEKLGKNTEMEEKNIFRNFGTNDGGKRFVCVVRMTFLTLKQTCYHCGCVYFGPSFAHLKLFAPETRTHLYTFNRVRGEKKKKRLIIDSLARHCSSVCLFVCLHLF